MKIGKIEEMYYDMVNSDEYCEAVTKAGETLQTDGRIKERIGAEAYMDIEDKICTLNSSYEQFGFVQGFKLAFKIAQEVYAK